MTFLERVGAALLPTGGGVVPLPGFDALVTLVLTILVAAVIVQNRRKNQSIAFEVENLIRRYIIFRGHRQALIKLHQGDEQVKHEMLRSLSGSWNQFKGKLETHALSLHETDRRARTLLYVLGLLMVLESLRLFVSGMAHGLVEWKGPFFLVRELPKYLFLVTGFLLIRIQSHRWKERPLTSFNGELDTLFSDSEQTQEALNNEFDPIEPSFPREESS